MTIYKLLSGGPEYPSPDQLAKSLFPSAAPASQRDVLKEVVRHGSNPQFRRACATNYLFMGNVLAIARDRRFDGDIEFQRLYAQAVRELTREESVRNQAGLAKGFTEWVLGTAKSTDEATRVAALEIMLEMTSDRDFVRGVDRNRSRFADVLVENWGLKSDQERDLSASVLFAWSSTPLNPNLHRWAITQIETVTGRLIDGVMEPGTTPERKSQFLIQLLKFARANPHVSGAIIVRTDFFSPMLWEDTTVEGRHAALALLHYLIENHGGFRGRCTLDASLHADLCDLVNNSDVETVRCIATIFGELGNPEFPNRLWDCFAVNGQALVALVSSGDSETRFQMAKSLFAWSAYPEFRTLYARQVGLESLLNFVDSQAGLVSFALPLLEAFITDQSMDIAQLLKPNTVQVLLQILDEPLVSLTVREHIIFVFAALLDRNPAFGDQCMRHPKFLDRLAATISESGPSLGLVGVQLLARLMSCLDISPEGTALETCSEAIGRACDAAAQKLEWWRELQVGKVLVFMLNRSKGFRGDYMNRGDFHHLLRLFAETPDRPASGGSVLLPMMTRIATASPAFRDACVAHPSCITGIISLLGRKDDLANRSRLMLAELKPTLLASPEAHRKLVLAFNNADEDVKQALVPFLLDFLHESPDFGKACTEDKFFYGLFLFHLQERTEKGRPSAAPASS